MSESRQPNPGAIPAHQRRLALIVTVVIGLFVIGGCLLVNLVAGSPVDWYWLIVGSLFISALFGAFCWVQLSE